ncbi:MAG TPA: hypothetical protein VMB02_16815 [Candidatus Aquilonibacter sp.]|nr:hypothetical protein [Candidatus Aquilonibacter sp.]
MHTALVGLFDTYDQAAAAVRDLEVAGIRGEQVEVISDVDRDVRAAALGAPLPEGILKRIEHAFRGLREHGREVHDDSGDMPDYIGEQEFYATHVREEGAVIVLRLHEGPLVGLAERILKEHGSKTRDGKSGVLALQEDDRPRQQTAGSGL